MHDDITDVPGIRVGNDTNRKAGTGCTVVLCNPAAVGGVDVRGGAPATHETDLLHPMNLVEEVNAVLLTGGSAFGLSAVEGVMRYLEERKIGFDTGIAHVPIVPAAAIFDLSIGSPKIRPNASSGYRACKNATNKSVMQGNVGVGTGATFGKITATGSVKKGGLGSASVKVSDGIIVGALVVVNAFGNIIDPKIQYEHRSVRAHPQPGVMIPANNFGNTTIAIVATSAVLTKTEINKVAQMAHDGMAQVIRPAHTQFDGDTVFALSLGADKQTERKNIRSSLVTTIGAVAADTLARAILKAVRFASKPA
jgi:L-aminopeptidase/D-esterase-like protein